MAPADRRVARCRLLALPLLAVIAAVLWEALPLKVTLFLLAWTLLSLPIGIAAGHCVLGEE